MEKQLRTVLVLLFVPVSIGAHSGDRVFPIPYLSDEMLAAIQLDDGRVDEWGELLGDPAMTLLDFAEQGGALPDLSDLDFRIWLGWHDDPDRLYVAFVASDDVYKNTHDYNAIRGSGRDLMHRHDSMSLAIDGDHSGSEGCTNECLEEDWLEFHSTTQYYDAIAHTASGPILDNPIVRYEMDVLAWTALAPFGGSGGSVAGEAPVISVIEFYVTPFDHLVHDDVEGSIISDLTAGEIIGFSIMVNDWDDVRYYSWTPGAMQRSDSDGFTDIVFLRADYFLDGILLPDDSTIRENDTAVESISWGLIKASLKFR